MTTTDHYTRIHTHIKELNQDREISPLSQGPLVSWRGRKWDAAPMTKTQMSGGKQTDEWVIIEWCSCHQMGGELTFIFTDRCMPTSRGLKLT